MQIVFIGPPGSGKGTQCGMLSDALGCPHLSTGELLRRTRGKSPLGDLVASYIDGGCLAPDFLVMPLVIKLLEQGDFHSGCLFDGFPRTVAQAAFLQNYLGERGQRIDLVLKLRVPREDLIARLSARAKLEGRADDSVEGIQRRLEIYQTRTEPVLSFYHELKIVREIDGSKAAGEVFSEIMDFVNVA